MTNVDNVDGESLFDVQYSSLLSRFCVHSGVATTLLWDSILRASGVFIKI